MPSRLNPAVALLVMLLAPAAMAHVAVDDQVKDLSQRIASEPERSDLYLKRAELHRSLGNIDAALEDFERSRKLDPGSTRVDLYLGRMWLRAGDTVRALPPLERYLGDHPDDPQALGLRGEARLRSDRFPGAAGDYSRAIDALLASGRLPPPDFYVGRARALSEAGEAHWRDALRGLEEGLAALGGPITLERAALEIETRMGQIDAALARVERLAASSQRPEVWLLRRADILSGAGRHDAAREAFRMALEKLQAGAREEPAR